MDFLNTITSLDISNIAPSKEYIFAISVIIGMCGHYCKKKIKNETDVSFWQWFGTLNVFSTFASFSTALVVVTGAISNGVITPDMNIISIMYIGLTSGFAVDSATNSD